MSRPTGDADHCGAPGHSFVLGAWMLVGIGLLASAGALHGAELSGASGAPSLQAVEGRILDASDGSPVPQALVRLVDGDGEVLLSTLSEPEGWFRLAVPDPGVWRLEVQRIGY